MAWLNARVAFILVQRPGQGVVRLPAWLLHRVARRFEGGITQFVADSHHAYVARCHRRRADSDMLVGLLFVKGRLVLTVS